MQRKNLKKAPRKNLKKAPRKNLFERRNVSRRLPRTVTAAIIADIMQSKPATDIALAYDCSRNTVERIHDHISRVGHYGDIVIKGPVPPLAVLPYRRRNRRHSVANAILKAVEEIGSGTPSEIHRNVKAAGLVASRSSIQNTLLRMKKDGSLVHKNRAYSLAVQNEAPE